MGQIEKKGVPDEHLEDFENMMSGGKKEGESEKFDINDKDLREQVHEPSGMADEIQDLNSTLSEAVSRFKKKARKGLEEMEEVTEEL